MHGCSRVRGGGSFKAAANGVPERSRRAPTETLRAHLLVLHPHSTPPLRRREMGPVRALHFFFALLAATIPFTAVSAHDTESVLDRPEEAFSYGQPLRDNVLLFPLDAQPARNKIDGLLSLSKLWSRQQQVACSTNYTICQGTQFCCPNGNACCSGEFLAFLRKPSTGGMRLYGPFTNHRYVQTGAAVVQGTSSV